MKFSFKVFERAIQIIFFSLLSLFILMVITKFFIFDIGSVDGVSMQPTLTNDNFFFTNKYTYLLQPPKRYDIVQIIDTVNNKMITKRIIGLPGEIITIKNGQVYLSTNTTTEPTLLSEPYLPATTITTSTIPGDVVSYTLEKNEYFVLGDNRAHSTDSRVVGPIRRDSILGKIVYDFTLNRPL